MHMRDGCDSYYVLNDGDERSVLRNRKFLRPTNESLLPEEATLMKKELMAEDHVMDSEIHFPMDTTTGNQADAILELGTSSDGEGGALYRRSIENDGEQRTRQEHSPAAVGQAQAGKEQYRQAVSQPASQLDHSPTNNHKEGLGRITRSKSRALLQNKKFKKVHFELDNNEYF